MIFDLNNWCSASHWLFVGHVLRSSVICQSWWSHDENLSFLAADARDVFHRCIWWRDIFLVVCEVLYFSNNQKVGKEPRNMYSSSLLLHTTLDGQVELRTWRTLPCLWRQPSECHWTKLGQRKDVAPELIPPPVGIHSHQTLAPSPLGLRGDCPTQIHQESGC